MIGKSLALILLCILHLLLSLSVLGQTRDSLSRKTANYEMNIFLNEGDKTLTCNTVLIWTNDSPNPIEELYFHLYYNAFKNSQSTFMRERSLGGGVFGGLPWECDWGYIEFGSITDDEQNDLLTTSQYIALDDGNDDDQTVLKIPLPYIVDSGETIRVSYKWKSKIARKMARTGYNQDYYFMAQWYPKIGVLEYLGVRNATETRWSCHQYHSSGEYYGEYGDHDVTLNVPKEYTVGASGKLLSSSVKGDRKIERFFANDVIDFTWTTSPHFKVHTDTWNDVHLKLLTYQNHSHFKERYFKTIKFALQYMTDHVGDYPYSTFTMVDPPIHGLFTGGMEYPNLVSSLSFNFFPEGIRSPETLLVHEFIHQYFQQMIGTNEQEDPWMDEGITSYYESRILDSLFSSNTSFIDFWGVKIGNKEYNRVEHLSEDNPKIGNNTMMAREFVHGGYGTIAYNKTAMVLNTLDGLMGRKPFDKAMKSYFEKWKFKHPGEQDFIDAFNETASDLDSPILGKNLDWFFSSALFGSDMCDYAVVSISNRQKYAPVGFVENEDDCVPFDKENLQDDLYRSKVVLHRLGEVIIPSKVLIIFDNGDEVVEHWDGKERSTEFNYKNANRIISAQVDPSYINDLDHNWFNNSKTVAKESSSLKSILSKVTTSIQMFMEGISTLI